MSDVTEIDSGTRELLAEVRGRVAVPTLNRPEARNALSDQLTPALRKLIKRFGDDPQVGAILITGSGNAFCAGGDVKGMGQSSGKAELPFEQRVQELRIRQRDLTGALVAVRKPTVAAIPGAAAGAGLALALACDIRIAAESSHSHHGVRTRWPVWRLRHRLVANAVLRIFACARIDVSFRADRCPPGGDCWPR